jgi:hypothetical protein
MSVDVLCPAYRQCAHVASSSMKSITLKTKCKFYHDDPFTSICTFQQNLENTAYETALQGYAGVNFFFTPFIPFSLPLFDIFCLLFIDLLDYILSSVKGQFSFQKQPEASNKAVEGGSLECLKIASSWGYKKSSCTCEHTARGGYLECLKYLHKSGCRWNKLMCNINSVFQAYSR